jgi:butyrate kinase
MKNNIKITATITQNEQGDIECVISGGGLANNLMTNYAEDIVSAIKSVEVPGATMETLSEKTSRVRVTDDEQTSQSPAELDPAF